MIYLAAPRRIADEIESALRAAELAVERLDSIAAVDELTPRPPSVVLGTIHVNDAGRLRQFTQRCSLTPFVALIDAGDVAAAILCPRNGAFDCLTSPYAANVAEVVHTAIAESESRLASDRDFAGIRQRMDLLTTREHQLVPLICEGLSNKEVAAKLDISIKTVANHRAQILKKTAARNTADMVRIATVSTIFLSRGFLPHTEIRAN